MKPERMLGYLGYYLGVGATLWLALAEIPGWSLAFSVGVLSRGYGRPEGFTNREMSVAERWGMFSVLVIIAGIALMGVAGWMEEIPRLTRMVLGVPIFAGLTMVVWKQYLREQRWMAEHAGDRYLP